MMQTRYRCWTCKAPVVRGERCTCGRGWFVEVDPDVETDKEPGT